MQKVMEQTRRNVCVFCGSNNGAKAVYRDAAVALGHALGQAGLGLVYGGAHVGLMGAVADAALESGARVIGVIPKSLEKRELAHSNLTELYVVETMHERKAKMADCADAFIALPGGLGTLDEFFEILTWAQLGIHNKPCLLLNTKGYFDYLLKFLDFAVDEHFIQWKERGRIHLASEPAEIAPRLQSLWQTDRGERGHSISEPEEVPEP